MQFAHRGSLVARCLRSRPFVLRCKAPASVPLLLVLALLLPITPRAKASSSAAASAPAPSAAHSPAPSTGVLLNDSVLASTLTTPARPGSPARAKLARLVVPLAKPTPSRLTGLAAPRSLTLLDCGSDLRFRLSPAQVSSWKDEIHRPSTPAARAALLHVHLGEYELSENEQPALAIWHFQEAQRLSHRSDSIYGLAA